MRLLPDRHDLRVTLVQGATRWHDPAGNRAYYGDLIAPLAGTTDLVVLPETFTSGFTNEAIGQRRDHGRPDRRVDARAGRRAGCGGHRQRAAATDERRISTACCSPRPTAACAHYDKRHLFRYRAASTSATPPARERLIVEWKGWRICPQVCYDLRFPVFSRNRFDVERAGLPGLRPALFVANWPSRARLSVEDPAARPRHREPVLRRRRQPRRHRWQRPALCRRQRGDRFPRPAAERSDR